MRELRNRFVCNAGLAAYSTRRTGRRSQATVTSCRRLDDRRAAAYPRSPSPPRHEMPEDSDSNFLIDRDRTESDDMFSPHAFKRKHSRRCSRRSMRESKVIRSGRMERLRLRPLKSTCYTDPHSSMHSNSSDNEKQDHDNLRRSTRQRKLQYDSFNTSWITDAQMVRGYPNLKLEFLSDQDSRHSQVYSFF